VNIRSGQIKSKSAQGGFTLIEVLLAFVVFALSFTLVLEILSGAMRNTLRAKQNTEVALIAQSVMDQVGLDIRLEAGATSSGEVGDYSWVVNVDPWDAPGENVYFVELGELTGIDLLEIEFLISWGSGSTERFNRFTTVKAVLPDRQLGGQ
jgi:general secretion pathway protein I